MASAAVYAAPVTVTLFDASRENCKGGQIYMGTDWGSDGDNGGFIDYPTEDTKKNLKRTDEDFLNCKKTVVIYNDALKSGDPNAYLTFNFGDVDAGKDNDALFMCALHTLGAQDGLTDDQAKEKYTIVQWCNVKKGKSVTVRLTDWTGSNWGQKGQTSAKTAAEYLKSEGKIQIDGIFFNLKSVKYTYHDDINDALTDIPDNWKLLWKKTSTSSNISKWFGSWMGRSTAANATPNDAEKDGKTVTEIKFGSDWLVGAKDDVEHEPTQEGAFSKAFHIPASAFQNITGGILADEGYPITLHDRIVVRYTTDSDNATGTFYFQDADGRWYKRGQAADCTHGHETNCNDDQHNTPHISSATFFASGDVTRDILNYRTIAALRTNGLWLDGINCEVLAVYLVQATENDYSQLPYFQGESTGENGSVTPGAGGDINTNAPRGYAVTDAGDNRKLVETGKRIDHSAFDNYQSGELIELLFDVAGTEPNCEAYYVRQGAVDMNVCDASHRSLTVDGDYARMLFRPTDREIRSFRTNGLILKGKCLNLKEINFMHADADSEDKDVWVYNDGITLGWDDGKYFLGDVYYSNENATYVCPESFSYAKQMFDEYAKTIPQGYSPWPYQLVIRFTWVDPRGNLTVYYNKSKVQDINVGPLNYWYEKAYGNNAATMNMPLRAQADDTEEHYVWGSAEGGAPVDNAEFVIQLMPDQLDDIFANGVYVKGANADLGSICIRPVNETYPDGYPTGVEDLMEDEKSGIDFNRPYEVYSLDGCRVSAIGTHGVYIVRQGNVVMKIAK